MNSVAWPERVAAGPWRAERGSGELRGPDGTQRLEPKVMDLLCLLAAEPGRVWTREQLTNALWPDLVVGDDSLARTVSKLRLALGDDARAPRWIETIAKRGYRWIGVDGPFMAADTATSSITDAPVAPSVPTPAPVSAPTRAHGLRVAAIMLAALAGTLAWWLARPEAPVDVRAPLSAEAERLLARADDFYFQFSRADNEAAIELYQRVLGQDPDSPGALAGLANALTQRAIRWPTPPGPDAIEFLRLGDARAAGRLSTEPALSQLRRARQLAEAAVARAPSSAAAYKALGLVASAQGELEQGLAAHRHAVELDPDAWGAMINLADVLEQLGRPAEARPWFERAYAAMDADYARNPAKVNRWREALGVLIADRHVEGGDLGAAETWYRRVLAIAPLHVGATHGLAAILARGGDAAAAGRLCDELTQRLGPEAACASTP